jgi:hypothetical protein
VGGGDPRRVQRAERIDGMRDGCASGASFNRGFRRVFAHMSFGGELLVVVGGRVLDERIFGCHFSEGVAVRTGF